MNVKRVFPSGYCKGVINAIKTAKETKIKYPDEKIYILGMLVHNDNVTKELDELGIITLDDSFKTKEELVDEIDEGIIIFTAHGISDSIKKKVNDKGLKYVDATCIDVLKSQNIIKDYLKEGYDVIYFGKKNHPEANAIISISDKIHLVNSFKDIDNLNIINKKIFLTNQTTMSFLELNDLIEYTKKKYPDILIMPEICNATSARQNAIYNLKDCDLLYVVGDVKSNNTNKLVEIAKLKGIKKVFLIPDFHAINKEDLIDINNIYVTAGASTPPILIEETTKYLSNL